MGVRWLAKNLLRYAFGADPRSRVPASAYQLIHPSEAEGDYLALSYRRLIGGGGLNYAIEVADNLTGPWDPASAQVEQVGAPSPNADGLTEQVTVRLHTPLSEITGKKFMRLRVTLP